MKIECPTVSVCMITYNHEDFIIEAIESVLMQKTNFDIELIIANDASSDKTNEIIESLILNHPRKRIIKYINRVENIGMIPNFMDVINKANGNFIAICEGDDYWTDPLKLQKQVDFLSENDTINMCFHRAQILKDNTLSLHPIPESFNEQPFKYIELIKHHNFIATASIMARKPKDFQMPDWFSNITFGDLGLYKLIVQDKHIQCLDEIMCVYRIHDRGAWSGLSEFKAKKNYLSFYKLIFSELNSEERIIAKNKIKMNSYKMSRLKFPKNRLLQKIYNMYLRLK